MATIDIAGRHRAAPARHGNWNFLRTLGDDWLRRRNERRAMAALSRLGPHLMRDIGLDPEPIEAAGGGWERLPPNRLLFPQDPVA